MPSGGNFSQIAKMTEEEAAATDDVGAAEKRLKKLKYARFAVVGTKLSVLALLVAILLGQESITSKWT